MDSFIHFFYIPTASVGSMHVLSSYAMLCHIFTHTPPLRRSSKFLSGVVIRRGVSKTTTSVSCLCDDRTGTETAVESATSRRTVGVTQTLARDELFAGAVAHILGSGDTAVDRGGGRLGR